MKLCHVACVCHSVVSVQPRFSLMISASSVLHPFLHINSVLRAQYLVTRSDWLTHVNTGTPLSCCGTADLVKLSVSQALFCPACCGLWSLLLSEEAAWAGAGLGRGVEPLLRCRATIFSSWRATRPSQRATWR